MAKVKKIKKRAAAVRKIKSWLLLRGPNFFLTQLALKAYGVFKGYRITFKTGAIEFQKNNRLLIISEKDCIYAPFIMRGFFEGKFNDLDAKKIDKKEVLDFSKPGTHRLKRYGVEFLFPAIADAPIEIYIERFKPKSGMMVFDVGAHVGSVSYFLSMMVGEKGRVYAFEPDDTNCKYLNINIKEKNLKNVTILEAALGSESGKKVFLADGSMRSSFVENAPYLSNGDLKKEVSVLTLEDCCLKLGAIPNFIKMDIEGAEVDVIKSSLEFLKRHPIHFAIESNHLTKDGFLTCYDLERLFRSIGYTAESSFKGGEVFTWATPPLNY